MAAIHESATEQTRSGVTGIKIDIEIAPNNNPVRGMLCGYIMFGVEKNYFDMYLLCDA